MIRVEICSESAAGVRCAQEAGADRVELCQALELGGLTPSPGLMHDACATAIPIRVLVRPRAGGFVYDACEIDVMLRDVAYVRAQAMDGVVVGASRADGGLDTETLARLVERSGTLGRTLHRAFDMTPDPFEALEEAIALGFDRILTSGQHPSAIDGAPLLEQLVASARGRITIMAGGGITPENAGLLVERTGVVELHASCRRRATSAPVTDRFGFGQAPQPTDGAMVEALVSSVRRLTVNEYPTKQGQRRG